MSYINQNSLNAKISEANELFYNKNQYDLYYEKLNEIICTEMENSFGFITPIELQNLSLSEIIERETFLIPYLSLFIGEITYLDKLNETCFVRPDNILDLGKVYSYYLSIPNTTNKLIKITYILCKLSDYTNKIRQDEIELYMENEELAKEIEREEYEEDLQSRINIWTLADKYH